MDDDMEGIVLVIVVVAAAAVSYQSLENSTVIDNKFVVFLYENRTESIDGNSFTLSSYR
jgi:hypothetical protein